MTVRQILVLIVLAGVVSLPFGMSACGDRSGSAGSREEAKKDRPDDSGKKKAEGSKEEKAAAGDFRLPDDPGGKLVSRVLAPTERLPSLDRRGPRTRPAPRGVDNPKLPLSPQVASLPRLPDTGPLRPLLPQMMTAEPLFGLEESFGGLPHAVSFPAGDKARAPSVDVTQPVALPRSAQPLLDRASLTDPTLDAAKAAILSAPLPSRETPVPFQRYVLPDPFENHDTVRLKETPGEERLPDGTVRPPR